MSALRAVPDLAGLDRGETVAALRRSMANLGAVVPVDAGGADAAAAGTDAGAGNPNEPPGPRGFGAVAEGSRRSAAQNAAIDSGLGRIAVPPGLTGLLDGGLARGAISAIDAAGAVVAGILAEVTAAGGHVALIGMPDFAAVSILEHGGDLNRVLAVPEPGENPLEVVALLADGVDLVVVDLPRTPSPSAVRPVAARLRSSGCAVLAVGEAWPTARVRVSSMITAVHGLGRGHGRIRGVEYRVSAVGGGRPERVVRWAVGECPASESAAVPGEALGEAPSASVGGVARLRKVD
ncbi:hypothetical protein [uncultured Corynebacterium sp.]|uniref:hypothetical protein n=1 Tax=uncultured Corynebacterium sp. TaxID=159447 RepID=UPI002603930A|nr:hypothetical protein [uncultured Corynebacterium sp.]